MRSHFYLTNPKVGPVAPSVGGRGMRSHFSLAGRAAVACALSGAAAMMTGVCAASPSASDSATDPAYSGGWSAGQNGGFGFGAWSFNGTDVTPGTLQEMSSASSLGTAWTLFNTNNSTGLANAGRAINGGLQVGQTFETVVQNPTTYHFFRGWDILFSNGTDNNPGGNNSAALYLNVFNYNYGTFNHVVPNWSVTDNGGGRSTAISPTGSPGLTLDLTLTSASTYSLTLTPLGNPSGAYTTAGTLAGSGGIDWVDFRLYNGASTGPSDTANNLEIGYMTIVPEPSSLALLGLGMAGLAFFRRRK